MVLLINDIGLIISVSVTPYTRITDLKELGV